MKKVNKKQKFILVFLLTILLARIIIYFIPRNSFIYQDQFHHIYIGIILLMIYFLVKKLSSDNLLAVSLGLIIDEITQVPFYLAYLFNSPLAPISFWKYWSNYSVISTIFSIIISIYLINKYKK